MESGKQTGDEDGDGDDSDDGGCGVEGAGGEGGGGESSNVEDEVIAGNVPGNPERDAKDLANLLVQGGPGTGKTWNRSAIDRVSKKRCRAERRRVEDPLPHPRCPQARLTQEHPAQRGRCDASACRAERSVSEPLRVLPLHQTVLHASAQRRASQHASGDERSVKKYPVGQPSAPARDHLVRERRRVPSQPAERASASHPRARSDVQDHTAPERVAPGALVTPPAAPSGAERSESESARSATSKTTPPPSA